MSFDLHAVASRFSEVRNECGLSQSEFARQLGISPRAVQSYEYAEREMAISVVDRLYEVFGVNPLWLLRGGEAAPQKPLPPEEVARLCAELYEHWQKALDALPVEVSFELRRTLFRKLSRSTFRDGAIPLTDIAETIEDLKP